MIETFEECWFKGPDNPGSFLGSPWDRQLNFSPNIWFFISWNQKTCKNIQPAQADLILLDDLTWWDIILLSKHNGNETDLWSPHFFKGKEGSITNSCEHDIDAGLPSMLWIDSGIIDQKRYFTTKSCFCMSPKILPIFFLWHITSIFQRKIFSVHWFSDESDDSQMTLKMNFKWVSNDSDDSQMT